MEPVSEVIIERQRAAVDALLATTHSLNPAVALHQQAAGLLAARMAREAGLSEELIVAVELSGYVHDIGLNGVDPRIIDKEEPLTEDEVRILQLHPYRGAVILERIPCLAAWAHIVRSHHERVDGSGYPDRLSGAEIPFESRLLAVADSFVSMTTTQRWRGIVSPFAAVQEIVRGVGSQYDEDAVQSLLRTLNVRPAEISETA